MENLLKQKNTQAGFIALMTSIIISAVLLSIVVVTGAGSFHSRFNSLYGENKRISLSLAESCVNSALLKLGQDYNYSPGSGENITIGSDSCTIQSITCVNSPCEDSTTHQKKITITTLGQYRNTSSSLSVVADITNPSADVTRAGLFVITNFVNDNGGTGSASNSTTTISGGSPSPTSTFSGSEAGVLFTINANTSYSVTANNIANYATPALSSGCSGAGLSPGATTTCLITYDDVITTGKITLVINAVNYPNNPPVPSNLPLSLDGVVVSTGIPQTVSPGAHTVSATSGAGYYASNWSSDCSGSYSSGSLVTALIVGDNKTCSINYINITGSTNIAPVSNAGADQTLTLSTGVTTTTTTLNASASYDPDGIITAYSWNLYSKPTGATNPINFTNFDQQQPNLTNLIEGVYVFRLTVTDNQNASSTDSVQIIINHSLPATPSVPIAPPTPNITIGSWIET